MSTNPPTESSCSKCQRFTPTPMPIWTTSFPPQGGPPQVRSPMSPLTPIPQWTTLMSPPSPLHTRLPPIGMPSSTPIALTNPPPVALTSHLAPSPGILLDLTPHIAQPKARLHPAPPAASTTPIDPQIKVDRTARVVSSLVADLTWVPPGGHPSLTPPL
ncbi:hypothetical protein BOTBODRAFT_176873 [Botryobasidium botryosum FD-172 SS1]|uniref:Uncharacterized protein n=1 Tax=Botryobasidium botryosum (strain FD-172 SS1) TaxID=930990 RepID=A0A067M8K8_BOTB1|nr:hypothetical protein BOTBODRAFT_176873 [Botryobasidium botryosum FD-172 SS1]